MPVKLLSNKLGNPTIIKKGLIDVISNGEYSALVWNQSSLKRCGGQGDLLAGMLATFVNYNCDVPLLDVVLACISTREAAN